MEFHDLHSFIIITIYGWHARIFRYQERYQICPKDMYYISVQHSIAFTRFISFYANKYMLIEKNNFYKWRINHGYTTVTI